LGALQWGHADSFADLLSLEPPSVHPLDPYGRWTYDLASEFMKLLGLLSILALGLLSGASALAHHSWPATYDLERIIEVEGELVRFLYRNPHSVVQVDVSGDLSESERWDAEWGGVYELRGQGIRRGSFRPGDTVRITGHPARNVQDRKIRILTLERDSDGFSWGRRPGEVVN
jgi:hypothetical protein